MTMKSADYHYAPKEGFVLTHFLTVADVKRSADFYLRILGGKVIRAALGIAAEIVAFVVLVSALVAPALVPIAQMGLLLMELSIAIG